MTNHTTTTTAIQTPWEIEEDSGNIVIWPVKGRNAILEFNSKDYDYDHAKTNALHIVKCVNSHEELLSACREAVTIIYENWGEDHPVLKTLSKAIANTEGK